MKLYLEPHLDKSANGGILRVVEAQHKYLPEFGIELTADPLEAEVTAAHVIGTPKNPTAPFIVHNHGLMWSEYHFPAWAEQVNKQAVESMQQAYAVTSPSQWVTHALARGMYKDVRTIYHGVDTEEWKPDRKEFSNYILWNKLRTDEVSDPTDMQKLAELLPDNYFVSTFGQETRNVKILGVRPYDQIKAWVQDAGLYLATARETFGIGTLEALACGVPVVGWDYGGQREIILNGETGYLAPYGDYAGLADCVRNALRDRERLSRNALDDVQARWQWRDKVEQYANLYYEAAAWFTAPRPKVTVVVPCHNLAQYLPHALVSIQRQTLTDFECLIIDDDSEDNTPEIARAIVEVDLRFRYYRTHENFKLSKVRNYGAQHALGKYVCYLDADDMLTPNSLELQAGALDADRTVDIVFGALEVINEEGTYQRPNGFPNGFNWFYQMAHQNQVPTGAMMRREVPLRSGGWRERQWRAEDAEFWSRATSFGYRAKMVTTETTLLYRARRDSKGSTEFRTYPDRDGNWLEYLPWRSADTAQEGVDYLQQYGDNVPQRDLVPFGAQGQPAGDKFWYVSHQQEPLVSIFINTSMSGHGREGIENTLDSIMGQTMNRWEVFVQGEPIPGFPWCIYWTEPTANHGATVIEVQAGEVFSNEWLDHYVALAELQYA